MPLELPSRSFQGRVHLQAHGTCLGLLSRGARRCSSDETDPWLRSNLTCCISFRPSGERTSLAFVASRTLHECNKADHTWNRSRLSKLETKAAAVAHPSRFVVAFGYSPEGAGRNCTRSRFTAGDNSPSAKRRGGLQVVGQRSPGGGSERTRPEQRHKRARRNERQPACAPEDPQARDQGWSHAYEDAWTQLSPPSNCERFYGKLRLMLYFLTSRPKARRSLPASRAACVTLPRCLCKSSSA